MRKRRLTAIIIFLYMAIIAAGCAPDVEPTVLDDFTNSTSAQGNNTSESTEESVKSGMTLGPARWKRDDKGHYLQYDGGEMCLPFSISATGAYTLHDIGVLLFVDGQIQPYKTSDEDTYQYMHIFSPEDGVELITDLFFTPMAGKKGDTLEIWYTGICWPDYSFLEDERDGPVFNFGPPKGGTRLKMGAAPTEAERPDLLDRIIDYTISQIPLTEKETLGWTERDFQEKFVYNMAVNPDELSDQRGIYIWNISEEKTCRVRFEVWGNPYVHYGLVLFVDHAPVSTAPEDLMFLTVEKGYKTVVEIELDMTGFDGESSMYAAIIPRNYRSTDVDTLSRLGMPHYVLLFDESPYSGRQ